MAAIFQKLLERGQQEGIEPGLTQQARDWFRKESDQLSTNPGDIINDTPSEQKESNWDDNLVGKMIIFNYVARTPNLPYWDRFPLVFPFAPKQSKLGPGWLGINMHYLQPTYRAQLMDGLYDLISDQNYNMETKIQMSYDLLKGVSTLKNYKPCVKHYLNSRLRTRIAVIEPQYWDIALFMPIERFALANKHTVWQDSRRIIRGQRWR